MVCGRRKTHANFMMTAEDTASETDISDYSEYEYEEDSETVGAEAGETVAVHHAVRAQDFRHAHLQRPLI